MPSSRVTEEVKSHYNELGELCKVLYRSVDGREEALLLSVEDVRGEVRSYVVPSDFHDAITKDRFLPYPTPQEEL